jgi:hypothetical protein
MPRRRRTSAGMEICPCAVSFEYAMAMAESYHGNGAVPQPGQEAASAPYFSRNRNNCCSVKGIDCGLITRKESE